MIECNLPEWAFLDGNSHLGNQLGDRVVILHIRSMSIIEIIDRDHTPFVFNEGVLKHDFIYKSLARSERISIALHECCTLDKNTDREIILNEILIPCAKWYCEYCAWEDNNIIVNEK